MGLLMSLRKLKLLKIPKRDAKIKTVYFEISTENLLYRMVNNKQLMSTAATVHWTPPFGIGKRSAELFGFVVRLENFLDLEIDDDKASEKSLCKNKLMLPDTLI